MNREHAEPTDADDQPRDDVERDDAPQTASAEMPEADKLSQDLADAEQRILRAHAELDNVRKRHQRELDETRRFAPLPLMRSLLGVVDNLERAIQAGRDRSQPSALLDGVEMVARQLQEILRQHGCTEIEALHAAFDPNKHEAVSQRADQQPRMTVVEVIQPGFQLHDRVVRPAQVIVSTGPPESSDES